jgi:kynurenine formamidase
VNRWRSARRLPGIAATAGLLLLGIQAAPLSASDDSRAGAWRGKLNPLTAQLVDLDQPLTTDAPIFPGDPDVGWELWNCVEPHPELTPRCEEGAGYQVERISSLGSHTGTHISVQCHFFESVDGEPARCLSEVEERFFGLTPLVVVDVRSAVAARMSGDFTVEVDDLRRWERRHGRIPQESYVVLLTGWGDRYSLGSTTRPGPVDDYLDPAPGFSGEAAAWLMERRQVRGLGSDTFGPDASSDENYEAMTETLRRGGITIENLGAGLARMRARGDYLTLNGAEYDLTPAERERGLLGFSGTQVGVTGYTSPGR